MVGIDTVILTLRASDFALLEPSRFTPNAMKIYNTEPKDMGRNKYISAICNPTKQDNSIFGYLPYITLYKALRAGGLSVNLRIQFSAPKIIFGNNVDEPSEQDFERICEAIFEGLKYYNIRLFRGIDAIKDARVAMIHYSKNFILEHGLSSRASILELQRIDVNSWRDVSLTDYNNGYGFKVHSKYYEVAFYDKIAEHFKGHHGQPLFDKDLQNQLNLFANPDILRLPEILRLEVRLNNTKSIKTALNKAGLDVSDLTFKALFNAKYSQKVLQQHLDDLYSHYPNITEADVGDSLELLSELYMQNPNRSISTILSAIGLFTISKEHSTRAMKDIIGSKGSSKLLRLAKKVNKELKYHSNKSEIFNFLEDRLERFEPISIANSVISTKISNNERGNDYA